MRTGQTMAQMYQVKEKNVPKLVSPFITRVAPYQVRITKLRFIKKSISGKEWASMSARSRLRRRLNQFCSPNFLISYGSRAKAFTTRTPLTAS